MTEQNNLNNDENYQSFNNPQKSQYNYLFLSEQQTQNEYIIENNIPFSNEQLNDQFLSGKRKKFQIIFSIILYILGLLLLLFDIINIIIFIIFINYKEEEYYNYYIKECFYALEEYFFYGDNYFNEFIIKSSILLIISILDIILASINVYYTKKYQNSRNKCAFIILGIIIFPLLLIFLHSFRLMYLYYNYFCFTIFFLLYYFSLTLRSNVVCVLIKFSKIAKHFINFMKPNFPIF